ncbi:hypothetical protein GCM10022261_06450 [Brevibacterium daeguense]|uniref:DUF2695 domain-containing protein n=1 Tax=Brevibacterium daeguense TaxID=909936 RepID=A0ABP8EGQ4_9MICO|nr:DUF2695 domain-containing protein [Brevibacterium daeguense]
MSQEIVFELERELTRSAERLTKVRPYECLVCYVNRMLEEFGCTGSRWMLRYRDLTAPRATALEERMRKMGAGCDCEVCLSAFEPDWHLIASLPRQFDRLRWNADTSAVEKASPAIPHCMGVRRGSTQPCLLWKRRPRR